MVVDRSAIKTLDRGAIHDHSKKTVLVSSPMPYSIHLICSLALCLASPFFSSAAGPQEKAENKPFADQFLSTLFNERVQQELELVPDQKAELKDLLTELQSHQKDLGEQLRLYADGATPEMIQTKRLEFVEKFEVIKTNTRQAIREVLLPHQQQRLSQVTAQLMLRESAKTNPAGVLAPEMVRFLEIDDQQAAKMKDKATEVRERLTREIARLTKEAQEELMNELTSEQREKYKSVVGDPVEGY